MRPWSAATCSTYRMPLPHLRFCPALTPHLSGLLCHLLSPAAFCPTHFTSSTTCRIACLRAFWRRYVPTCRWRSCCSIYQHLFYRLPSAFPCLSPYTILPTLPPTLHHTHTYHTHTLYTPTTPATHFPPATTPTPHLHTVYPPHAAMPHAHFFSVPGLYHLPLTSLHSLAVTSGYDMSHICTL